MTIIVNDTIKGAPGMGDMQSYLDTRQAFAGLFAGEILEYGTLVTKGAGSAILYPSAATSEIIGMVRRPVPSLYPRVGLNDLVEVIPLEGNQLILRAEVDIPDDSDIFVRHTVDAALNLKGSVSPAAGTGLVKVGGLKSVGASYSVTIDDVTLKAIRVIKHIIPG
jgi:hypothetical protein